MVEVAKDDKSDILELFLKIGLDERTAKNTIANNKVTSNLTAVIHEATVTDGCDRRIGNLLYTVATKYPANALLHCPTLLQYVDSSKIKTPAQLEAAFLFFSSTGSENFEVEKFEGLKFQQKILSGLLLEYLKRIGTQFWSYDIELMWVICLGMFGRGFYGLIQRLSSNL